MDTFFAVDLETTGLEPGDGAITEVGAVLFVRGVEVSCFSSLVRQARPIPEHIVELTGITDEMCARAPSWNTVRWSLADWMYHASGGNTRHIVAHNAEFDMGWIVHHWRDVNANWRPRFSDWHCSKERFARLYPDHTSRGSASLPVACARLRVPMGAHHRALGDARACGLLWLALESKEEVVERRALDDVPF